MIKAVTKSRELEESLIKLIVRDGLKVGDSIMPETRMASVYGVSRVTVRQAIANLEESGILRSEQGRGTFIAKLPKSPRNSVDRSMLIGFVCYTGIDNPYMGAIARGIESGAETEGYHICFGSVMGSAEREAEVIRKLLKRGVEGLVVSPTESHPASVFLQELARTGMPLVIVDENIAGLRVPSACCDDREGGFLATSLLLENGHRRIAHLRGPELKENAISRLAGYSQALALKKIIVPTELTPALENPKISYTEQAGYALMKKLLALPKGRRPTAAFAANDIMALGAYAALKEGGLRVPEDFSLVGYGNLPINGGLHLTSVDQHPGDIGRAAWNLLSNLIAGGDGVRNSRMLLRPELVIRSSVSTPSTAIRKTGRSHYAG